MKDPWKRHDQLAVESKCVCEAADGLGDESAHAMRSQIDRAYEFLAHRFLPNARAEHRLLQRMADHDYRRLTGDAAVEQIETLTEQLGKLKAKSARRLTDETIREARRILYEVAGLLQAHYGGAAT